jgi:hypothetical protein
MMMTSNRDSFESVSDTFSYDPWISVNAMMRIAISQTLEEMRERDILGGRKTVESDTAK